MFRIAMALLDSREVSVTECAYRLCGLKLKESSRKLVFLNTRSPGKRYGIINLENVELCSNIFERYEQRPNTEAFNNMIVGEFAMFHEPVYKSMFQDIDAEEHEDVFDDDKMEQIDIEDQQTGGLAYSNYTFKKQANDNEEESKTSYLNDANI